MHTLTSADGVTIAYERSGRGPALVIVNGALSTRQAVAPLTSLLESEFTVYRYDRRGRGHSSDSDSYAVERELEDLAAVARTAGDAPYVYGHSSGGALSLEAAATGVSMRGLVVHEPPYVPGPPTSPETADDLSALVAGGRRDEAVERFLGNTGVPETMLAQIRASPVWGAMLGLAHTLPYDVRLCNEGRVPAERLAQIPCPVLATVGSLSAPWALEAARAVAAAIPDGDWRTLEGQSHAIVPDVLAALLRERFASQ
ncbi:MAG: alpha/beta fold hydrolase [Solirubrobacteraceae bacterium]|jgi:pimeloyl-ACP methyl ester carboxylesterase